MEPGDGPVWDRRVGLPRGHRRTTHAVWMARVPRQSLRPAGRRVPQYRLPGWLRARAGQHSSYAYRIERPRAAEAAEARGGLTGLVSGARESCHLTPPRPRGGVRVWCARHGALTWRCKSSTGPAGGTVSRTARASPRGGVRRKPQARRWPDAQKPHTRRPRRMRGPLHSKSDTCPEGAGVDAAGISVKVSASYPGRSVRVFRCGGTTVVARRRDERAEVSPAARQCGSPRRSRSCGRTEGPNKQRRQEP